jgi:hypothetical protein
VAFDIGTSKPRSRAEASEGLRSPLADEFATVANLLQVGAKKRDFSAPQWALLQY